MSESDLLNPIVKRIERSTPLDTASQTKVEIDLTPNRVMFKQLAYYLVSHNAEVKAGLTVPVESFEQGWILHLAIDYIATMSKNRLPDKAARTLVEALRTKVPQAVESFQVALETRLRGWVYLFLKEHGGPADFIRQYERYQSALSAHIRSLADREVGLDLIPKIDRIVPGEEFKERIPVNRPVTIELRDYPTPIKGALNLDMVAVPGVWAHIHYGGVEKLCDRMASHTELFMRNITLHQINSETEMEKVRESLGAELDKLARVEGRTIQALKPPCSSPVALEVMERAKGFRTIKRDKTYPLLEYPHPISVVCELQMELTNVGAFIAAKTPNAERWAEVTFWDLIQKHLLDVSYIALFRQSHDSGVAETGFATFDRKMEQTKTAIRSAAHKIGFDAYSIAIRTNLQFDELRREFRIAIDRGPEEFEMNVPNCPAALDIEVTARISSEKIIKELFRQDPDIKKVIRKELKEKISNKLKETSPERYYINFDRTHEKGQKSLVEELQEIIRTAMQKYEATLLTVTCPPSHKEELWKVYDELIKEERQFNILAEMSQLEFNVVFRVDSVVSRYWYEFQTKRPTLDKVQIKVEHCVGEWLAPKGRDELLYRADDFIKEEMYKRVNSSVAEEFGVSVKITHLTRLRSTEDDAFNQKVTGTIVGRIRANHQEDEAELAALQDELQILYDREKVALETQTYDELPKIRELIREKREQLREVSERLRLSRVSDMLERGIEAQIGGLGGRGILQVPSLPEPEPGSAGKRAAAATATESASTGTDSNVNGLR